MQWLVRVLVRILMRPCGSIQEDGAINRRSHSLITREYTRSARLAADCAEADAGVSRRSPGFAESLSSQAADTLKSVECQEPDAARSSACAASSADFGGCSFHPGSV